MLLSFSRILFFFVSVDPECAHRGRQSLRITQPDGSREPVRVHATGKLCRFRAGETYRVDAFVHISDKRAAQGDVGLWFGEDLISRLSPQDAAAATEGWVAINGLYEARTTERVFVRLGVNNVTGATVWFDDATLRVAASRANALRLTMLGCPGTEVIASDGEGLRPFQQPLLIVRRRAKATAFANVLEPYYGQPVVEAVRALGPDHTGAEVVTDRTIDRFLVSDGSRRETTPDLSVRGMVGAVSVDRTTNALRWLCVGSGTQVSTGLWSLATTAPATLHLERIGGRWLLRTWGEYRGPVTIRGPGISADLIVNGAVRQHHRVAVPVH